MKPRRLEGDGGMNAPMGSAPSRPGTFINRSVGTRSVTGSLRDLRRTDPSRWWRNGKGQGELVRKRTRG